MSFTFNLNQSYFVLGNTNLGALPPVTVNSQIPSNLIDVSLYPHWYSYMTIEWTIPVNWGNCTFNIYFSQGSDIEFTKLNTTPLTTPYYRDSSTKEYSRYFTGKYVVEVVLPNGKTIQSLKTGMEYKRRGKLEKIADEIQRREFMLLSKFAGVKAFLFKKRHYGQRCHRCWNNDYEKIVDDNCPVCYGTSWEGGYFDPIPIFMQFTVNPTVKIKSYIGETEPNSIEAWTISNPTIISDDVIVRLGDFEMYRVIDKNETQLQTKSVRQIITLTQLSKSDVEYLLIHNRQYPEASKYFYEISNPKYTSKRFPDTLVDMDLTNDYSWAKSQDLINLPVETIFINITLDTNSGGIVQGDLTGYLNIEEIIDGNTGSLDNSTLTARIQGNSLQTGQGNLLYIGLVGTFNLGSLSAGGGNLSTSLLSGSIRGNFNTTGIGSLISSSLSGTVNPTTNLQGGGALLDSIIISGMGGSSNIIGIGGVTTAFLVKGMGVSSNTSIGAGSITANGTKAYNLNISLAGTGSLTSTISHT